MVSLIIIIIILYQMYYHLVSTYQSAFADSCSLLG